MHQLYVVGMYITPLGNHYMMYVLINEDDITFHSPSKRVNNMIYQNHRLEMLIQWKRWMDTKIHLDHYSPLMNQWSPLHQVPLGDRGTFVEFEPW
jgi:hypothetical protein